MKQIILMIVAFVVMVYVNAKANMSTINGQTTSEVSNKLDVLFTPAGYVFSIWGLIYLLLAIWLYLQLKHRNTSEKVPGNVGYLFIISCILNISWLFAWHYEMFILSLLIMVLLLLTLIAIYKSYPVGDSEFGGRLPFSFYLGWISVATIANTAYTLKYYDVSLGIDEVTGTIVLVIFAGLLALIGQKVSDDSYFAIVFVWAIIGIAASNTAPSLIVACFVLAIVVLIAIIAMSFMKNRNRVSS